VTVSEAWSASTFARIVKPSPLGSGIFAGNYSFPWTCPNSLVVQSWAANNSGLGQFLHCDGPSSKRIYAKLDPYVLSGVKQGAKTEKTLPSICPLYQAQPSTGVCQSMTCSTNPPLHPIWHSHPTLGSRMSAWASAFFGKHCPFSLRYFSTLFTAD
jgi:hypothetical protein